jgi:hypothetical protein
MNAGDGKAESRIQESEFRIKENQKLRRSKMFIARRLSNVR